MVARVSKTVTNKEDIDFLLSLTPKDITQDLIMDIFGDFNGKKRFNTYDILSVPPGSLGTIKNGKNVLNSNSFVTTVGRWIFNVFFIFYSPEVSQLLGYINTDVTKKYYGKLFDKLTYGFVEDKVSLEDYKRFLMNFQFFMQFVSILSPSYSDKIITIADDIKSAKEKLVKEHEEEIKKGNIFATDKISAELLARCKEILKDDPAMDLFNSGIGSFDNQFKNIYVMRGAVKDPDPTKGYNAITSSYMNGIKKEEYSKIANSLAAGPYARAKKTEMGGHWEKLFAYAFGHVVCLDHGVDCGTKRTLKVHVTEKNIGKLMYSYIMENGRPVEINSLNKDKYIGKDVNLRFSSLCESKEGICNICIGELPYKTGVRNVGLLTQQIPSTMKVASMKQFHDDQVSFIDLGNDIDPIHVFGLD